ncbi:MAG: Histone transcription regulator 3 [Sclerophora amabilis]|nr:MAG: Histone transcription regulator 3 [Sclerophora amabilis]
MSTFTALNIIPDEDSDDEIDNTKEIQTEEALKLYQNAVKLHSQGPEYIKDASDAYTRLFNSDIFQYPESLPGYSRAEQYDHELSLHLNFDKVHADALLGSSLAARSGSDGLPSTLPQLLHLAYKNRGQLALDYLKRHFNEESATTVGEEAFPDLSSEIINSSTKNALMNFSEALARDETDGELWRRTSRIASSFGSKRIMRFCLEAVLDVEDEGLHGESSLVGLEEAFAGEQLTELLHALDDQISISRPPISTFTQKRLTQRMKRILDPFPYLPDISQKIDLRVPGWTLSVPSNEDLRLDVVPHSWAALGKSMLQYLDPQLQGSTQSSRGARVFIDLQGAEVEGNQPSASGNGQPVNGSSQRDNSASSSEAAVAGRKDSANTDVVNPENDADMQNDAMENSLQGAKDTADGEVGNETPKIVIDLPTRKRSPFSAGLQETADGSSRVRSKRIKARESIAEAEGDVKSASEIAKQCEERQQSFEEADEWMFHNVNNLLAQLGVEELGDPNRLRQIVLGPNDSQLEDLSEDSGHEIRDVAVRDMYAAVKFWNDDKGKTFLNGDGIDASASTVDESNAIRSRNAGITAFLEHSRQGGVTAVSKPTLSGDEGLARFAKQINKEQLSLRIVGMRWLESLLLPEIYGGMSSTSEAGSEDTQEPSYVRHTWPHPLKEAVVLILVCMDDLLYLRAQQHRFANEARWSEPAAVLTDVTYETDEAMTILAQTIFELHLDIYASITNPSSRVDTATRLAQRDRLERWATVVNDIMNLRNEDSSLPDKDSLTLRYLWASAIHASVSDNTPREHVILCMEDLQVILRAAGDPIIHLPNNAVMPDVSSAAAERETSKLTTMDFFLQIFQNEDDDPIAVIEILEPVLDPQAFQDDESEPRETSSQDVASTDVGRTTGTEQQNPESTSRAESSPNIPDMRKFLESGTASLRLFLWKKLRDAYESIEYPPKVMSCYLRSIEVVIAEFHSSRYLEIPSNRRQVILMKWLHVLDDLVSRALTVSLENPGAFDCVDREHLLTSLTANTTLFRLLHGFALFEDLVRAGQLQVDCVNHTSLGAFVHVAQKLREMQIRTWTLLYSILKEGIEQHMDITSSSTSDILIELLRSLHHAAGIRFICSASNKVFLKLMQSEILRLDDKEGWEPAFAQILFDLYGLRLGAGVYILEDHGCIPDPLDRRVAIRIMDFVLTIVRGVNVKDLPKTDYKATIDKMQHAIGAPKPMAPRSHNLRIFESFLKMSINPRDLFRCLRGQIQLSTIPVKGEIASIAEKGWYFLLGQMALTRFRSQKRVSSGSTDDLNIASTFFRRDLEFSVDRWETWYRQAQTYDSLLEEGVAWSAEKLNKDHQELFTLQRNAINCYTMAVSTAIRLADSTEGIASKMSDLYTNFGCRIYATSRPPFGLEPFRLDNSERFFSGIHGMYKKSAHAELSDYKAWSFATVLFKKAQSVKPDYWINYYMMGKCLWKMFQHVENVRDGPKVEAAQVIQAFEEAVRTVPERRSDKQDPILEPHYKLVSVVHKLVRNECLEPDEACKILQLTPYARHLSHAQGRDEWDAYVLNILKSLRVADKANWHHRMIARAAYIHYDGSSDETHASAARHELSQHIFTKTMAIQVWKPEYERAGRHFWYTSQYTSFFVRVLGRLNDRAGMEALMKRVRKRTSEFYSHTKIWGEVCLEYLKLLRRAGQIPEGHEDAVFKSISNDDFQARSMRLQSWCHLPSTSNSSLDILRDVIELKRLNNNLMKSTLLDDLTTDTYSLLYETVVPDLMEKTSGEQVEKKDEKRDMMNVNNLLMSTDGASEKLSIPPTHPDTTTSTGVKQRIKGVGRREIIRKAEAAVTKPASALAPSAKAPPRPIEPPTRPIAPATGQPAHKAESPSAKDDAGTGMDSSAPGSVHDSADDESDDSDTDEQPKMPTAKPMFPNLGRSSEPNDTAGVVHGQGQGNEDEKASAAVADS